MVGCKFFVQWLVHGGFTNWSMWSACTLSCGTGSQSRSRACTNPTPMHGGNDCSGAVEETLNCNTQMCPIHGGYSTWSLWTICTLPCGINEYQSRSRTCTEPTPAHGGQDCPGESLQSQACNVPCIGNSRISYVCLKKSFYISYSLYFTLI